MRVFLGVTGASGAPYAARALSALCTAGCEVGLCVSHSGAHVISHELLGRGPEPPDDHREVVERFVEDHGSPENVTLLGLHDMTTPFASGSSNGGGVLVLPCSGSSLGAIAHGTGTNLIHRAADVALKERRPLVLVTRETPLSLIAIENMATLTRAGAMILPASPGFYALPGGMDDLIDFVVGKALDAVGVRHSLLRRWGEASVGPAVR
ncbi:MAG: UbiX family flavin prenyltransferase [Miltoncostaeaceae bacterium]